MQVHKHHFQCTLSVLTLCSSAAHEAEDGWSDQTWLPAAALSTSPLPALLQHSAPHLTAPQAHRVTSCCQQAAQCHKFHFCIGHFILQAPSLCCMGPSCWATTAQPCSKALLSKPSSPTCTKFSFRPSGKLFFPTVLYMEQCWCSFKPNCLLLSKHNTDLQANANVTLYYEWYLNQHQMEDDPHRLTGLF